MSKYYKKKHKIRNRVLLVLGAVLLIGIGYGAFLLHQTYQPMDEALSALESDENVTVTTGDNIVFMPASKPDTGFIFYPGGLVEPEAYASVCRRIAEEGYLVVIAPMTWNLAVLSPDKADDIIAEYDSIEHWAIGGHSLGGVMAADYASGHNEIEAVILYAAYPQSDTLAESSVKVLSLYGSEDGVADIDKITNAKLPASAKLIEISGGNHCFFGSYGMQKGDNPGTISREEQQQQAIEETVVFLKG